MAFVRIYTGDDGQTHFEDLDLPGDRAIHSGMQVTPGVNFRRFEPGYFSDWHTAPRRQYVITLAGEMEVGIGDGTKRRFGAGDVLLADDLTGQGHTTAVVGDQPRVSVTIPLTLCSPWLPADE